MIDPRWIYVKLRKDRSAANYCERCEAQEHVPLLQTPDEENEQLARFKTQHASCKAPRAKR